MKTSTFKEKVEELGFETIGERGIDILAKYGGGIVAFITNLTQFGVYIYQEVPPELFDLIVEYARTPIEERKDEKKYRLRLPLMKDDGYLNTTDGAGYFLSNKSYLEGYQTTFTASEIAKLEEKYNLGSFEREEVIEDEAI